MAIIKGVYVPDSTQGDSEKVEPRQDDFLKRVFETKKTMDEEALRLQIVRNALAPVPVAPPPVEQPFKITANLDLGAIVNNALNTIKDMPTALRAEQQHELIGLKETLLGLQRKLEAEPQKTSIQTYREVKGELDSLTQEIKSRLNIEDGVHVSTSNIPQLIELEERKMEREERSRQWQQGMEERRHQWEEEMALKRHQWDVEQHRWSKEFDLKLTELSDNRKVRDGALSELGALASSIVEGVESPAGELQPRRVKAGQPTPTSFLCECGKPLQAPQQVTAETQVTCLDCGAVYGFNEQQ